MLYSRSIVCSEGSQKRSQLQGIIEDAGHILSPIQSSTVNSTGKSITGDALSIVHASTAIILYQVSNLRFPPAHGPGRPPCSNLLTVYMYLTLGLQEQALAKLKFTETLV